MNFTKVPIGMCDGFVILKRCEEKTTKNGALYLDMIIGDKDGEMSAKMWDLSQPGLFEQDMIVKIRGTVEQYNGKDQFRVSQMRPVNSSDQYNLNDLVPATEIGGEQLFNMIKKRVEAFENKVFIADVGDSPADWDTIDITIDDIEKVIHTSTE